MTLSDLASVGSLVGGLAVVVSLLFVGFQLRQNTLEVRAGTSRSHAGNWSQLTSHDFTGVRRFCAHLAGGAGWTGHPD